VVFSSPLFLFLFLPLVLAAYRIAPWRARNAVLLVASLLFYAWGETEYVAVMLVSILANYGFAVWIGRTRGTRQAKVGLALSVAFDLGLLLFFKYAVWAFRNVASLCGALGLDPSSLGQEPRIHLPLGISFYTFHAMSAVIDVYRGDARVPRKILDFGLYIACFPQLVAGPIIRYEDVADQIEHRRVTFEGFAIGVRGSCSASKKVLLANTIAQFVDEAAVPTEPLLGRRWLAPSATSGSTSTSPATGHGDRPREDVGFVYRENFDHPYVSTSITEFWRRWHISLSTWFKNYLYIPLGGNRKGPARTYLNLVVVFLLVGLWHGAAWQFVAFGAFHGSMMILERAGLGRILDACPVLVRRLYFGVAVLVGWSFFRAGASVRRSTSPTAATPFRHAAEPYPRRSSTSIIALVAGSCPRSMARGDRALARRALRPRSRPAASATGALLLLALAGSLLPLSGPTPSFFRFASRTMRRAVDLLLVLAFLGRSPRLRRPARPALRARHRGAAPAPMPKRPETLGKLEDWPAAYEAWYLDHFGLRDRLLRWNSAWMWFVVGVSPTRKFVRGVDDWIFQTDFRALDDHRGVHPLSHGQLDAWRRYLEGRRDGLRARGIEYVFAIAPHKSCLYPELVPPAYLLFYGGSKLWHRVGLRQAAEIQQDIDVAPPCARRSRATLRAILVLPARDLLTGRDDRVGYGVLAAKIARFRVPAALGRGLRRRAARGPGRLRAGRMYLDGLLFQRSTAWTLRARGPAPLEPDLEPAVRLRARRSLAPRAVLFHDSYGVPLRPLLAEGLSRLVAVWSGDVDWKVVEREKPDVVIQLITEQNFQRTMPQLTADEDKGARERRFDSSDRVLWRFDPVRFPHGLVADGKARLRLEDGAVVFERGSAADVLLLPEIGAVPGMDLVVRFDLERGHEGRRGLLRDAPGARVRPGAERRLPDAGRSERARPRRARGRFRAGSPGRREVRWSRSGSGRSRSARFRRPVRGRTPARHGGTGARPRLCAR
jgi:alginate O-acetyltransferase complex protein AlgI